MEAPGTDVAFSFSTEHLTAESYSHEVFSELASANVVSPLTVC